MTLYSRYEYGGQVRILATYPGATGVESAEVTSVEDAGLAVPIVDALNRVSACAAVTLGDWDRRNRGLSKYPSEHLAALDDPRARPRLLEGAYGLWYEQVKVLLHLALHDLDAALAPVPEAVRDAVTAELATEAGELREAAAEFWGEGTGAEDVNRRHRPHEPPFIPHDGGQRGLRREDRDHLDDIERGVKESQLGESAGDLRLLRRAWALTTNKRAHLQINDFEIVDDPCEATPGRYFLDLQAPMPNGFYGREGWLVELNRWLPIEPTSPKMEVTGETVVLACLRPEPPALEELIELLDRSGGNHDQLVAWTKTPVGEPLAGTSFVVTDRDDEA